MSEDTKLIVAAILAAAKCGKVKEHGKYLDELDAFVRAIDERAKKEDMSLWRKLGKD